MVWIWQLDKRTDDYKTILNLCKKTDEKNQKRGWKRPKLITNKQGKNSNREL